MVIKYAEAQLLSTFAWALRDHVAIVSGAYKLRTTQQGVALTDEEKEEGKEPWRDCTEDEKLKQAMATLTQRCHWLNETAEYIADLNKEEAELEETLVRATRPRPVD